MVKTVPAVMFFRVVFFRVMFFRVMFFGVRLSRAVRFSSARPFANLLFLIGVIVFGIAACSHSPSKSSGYTQTGEASYYANKFQGRKTASGEKFNQKALTAAHKKLPFGTKVRVTNKENGKSVVVKINDRGPFVKGRIIDLSRRAFVSIADVKAGVVKVKIQALQ